MCFSIVVWSEVFLSFVFLLVLQYVDHLHNNMSFQENVLRMGQAMFFYYCCTSGGTLFRLMSQKDTRARTTFNTDFWGGDRRNQKRHDQRTHAWRGSPKKILKQIVGSAQSWPRPKLQVNKFWHVVTQKQCQRGRLECLSWSDEKKTSTVYVLRRPVSGVGRWDKQVFQNTVAGYRAGYVLSQAKNDT